MAIVPMAWLGALVVFSVAATPQPPPQQRVILKLTTIMRLTRISSSS